MRNSRGAWNQEDRVGIAEEDGKFDRSKRERGT